MEVMAMAAVAGATALAGWFADRRRARTRHEQAECATCGMSLRASERSELHLIHGRLVCPACAEAAKRKTVGHFAALTGATVFATAAIATTQGAVALLAFPLGSALVMTGGALHLMKRANRRAQERIARGADPSFEALGPEAPGTLIGSASGGSVA